MAPSIENPISIGPNVNGSALDGPTPTISTRLHVEKNPGAFTSRAISLIELPANALFARITTATPAKKAYSSVQTSPTTHIELNSDLIYCNHSCEPSLIFDMTKFEVRVVGDRDLKKGDALTFFYPSSEWDMAQPFDCSCGSAKCLGTIRGAGELDRNVLGQFWLNDHILRLLKEENATGETNGGR